MFKYFSNRIIPKRINVRIEHVRPSKCRVEFLKRVKENDEKRKKAKELGVRYVLKRQPEGPRPAHLVRTRHQPVVTLQPLPYELIA